MRYSLLLIALSAACGSPVFAKASSAAFSGGSYSGDDRYVGIETQNTPARYGNVTVTNGKSTGVNQIYGGKSDTGDVLDNKVDFQAGTLYGYIQGGQTTFGTVQQNSVTIRGGSISGSVCGGWVDINGKALNNSVTLLGGTVGDVMGGTVVAWMKYIEAAACYNNVVITGGTVNGSVVGGKAPKEVAHNTITVCGGAIKGDVYGAQQGTAVGNTVNLVGQGASLGNYKGSGFAVVGGVYGADNAGAGNSLNTINVYGTGISAQNIGFVQQLNFYLSPAMKNGNTMLTLTADQSDTDLSGVKIGVACSGTMQLTANDTVTLIAKNGGQLETSGMTAEVDMLRGVTATYTGTVAVDGNNLVLIIGGGTPRVEENTLKSMTETRTNTAAMVNSAADFMATTAMQQAKTAAKAAAAAGKYEAAPFVALGGSHLRYNTGSHVDADGFNGALGVAKTVSPSVTLGVAGEYGCGDYKSYVGGVRGKGDSKLYGGAILADWQGKRGWHAEGAVRLGRTHTDYSAMNPLGYTNYSDKASYQSALIGGGKEFKVSPKSNDTVDVYARYMYGHTNGSNAKASSGESLHFSGVNSHRTLVGARYNYELTDHATLYAGAAWMHEFKGDARAVIGGFTSPSPSLKGNSGMVELGTTFAPFASDRVLLNLNVQGWTGVQRGISGGAGCTVKF